MNEFMAKHEPWSRWDGSRVMASRSVLEPVVWSPGGCWSRDKADEVHEGEKRKGKGDRGGRGDNRHDYNNRQNQRRANAGAMTNVVANDNEVYPKWKMQDTKHNGDAGSTQDPKVVTGTFLLNNRYATALFDSGADKSFVSTNFSTLIDIKPVELDTSYEVELVDGKVEKGSEYIEKGCELFLAQVTEQESKEKRLEDVPVITSGNFRNFK
ncbi:putative reverse transcriptase domain-containing protein [Tanacetum coccineum]